MSFSSRVAKEFNNLLVKGPDIARLNHLLSLLKKKGKSLDESFFEDKPNPCHQLLDLMYQSRTAGQLETVSKLRNIFMLLVDQLEPKAVDLGMLQNDEKGESVLKRFIFFMTDRTQRNYHRGSLTTWPGNFALVNATELFIQDALEENTPLLEKILNKLTAETLFFLLLEKEDLQRNALDQAGWYFLPHQFEILLSKLFMQQIKLILENDSLCQRNKELVAATYENHFKQLQATIGLMISNCEEENSQESIGARKVAHEPFKIRVLNDIVMSFLAHEQDLELMKNLVSNGKSLRFSASKNAN